MKVPTKRNWYCYLKKDYTEPDGHCTGEGLCKVGEDGRLGDAVQTTQLPRRRNVEFLR